jgi:hypothetical protein
MANPLEEYRESIVSAKQQSQNNFDKYPISLCGGALAVTLTFIKNIIGDNPIEHRGFGA